MVGPRAHFVPFSSDGNVEFYGAAVFLVDGQTGQKTRENYVTQILILIWSCTQLWTPN
jgi:hypothetical protein